MKKNIKQLIIAVVIALIIGIVIGALIFSKKSGGMNEDHSAHQSQSSSQKTEKKETVWTCSMHPQIRQAKAGKCPICSMDLIPTDSGDEKELGERALTMSEASKKLAQIETAIVKHQQPEVQVELYGQIAWDETRIKTISSYFPGRIDRLFLDYTGIEVKKGDHLAKIYSPDLLSAQAELLTAIKYNNTKSIKNARDKLRLWGFPKDKIQQIEQSGKTSDNLEIDSPVDGIVIHKMINEGDYVKTGSPFFKIADSSHIWLLLDAYESDLSWLHFGQRVEFSAEGIPGEKFSGIISFISPELDKMTRTVKVRVNAENPDGQLRPGMFANAIVKAQIASNKKVIAPDLADKWMCPMHPEIVENEFAQCPVCGMDLVETASLGYISTEKDTDIPLVIPASAPLITGKRAVVYVEIPDTERPSYEGRSVELGARAGDFYIVKKGLKEGEKVVTQGAFLLDASLQISAKPSMMSADEVGKSAKFHSSPAFVASLGSLLKKYYTIQAAFAGDDLDKAKSFAQDFLKELEKVDMKALHGKGHDSWMSATEIFKKSIKGISEAENIKSARKPFEPLSEHMIFVIRSFGTDGSTPINLTFCPMAFKGKGANWLQKGDEVRNPYYGDMMLNCGEFKENLSDIHPKKMNTAKPMSGHNH